MSCSSLCVLKKKIDAYLNHIEKELTVAESASTVMDSYIDYKNAAIKYNEYVDEAAKLGISCDTTFNIERIPSFGDTLPFQRKNILSQAIQYLEELRILIECQLDDTNELKDSRSVENCRPPKIFISHCEEDKGCVNEFVRLLECIGFDENVVFCSSIPEYGIPNGEDIFSYLRKQFEEYSLHVILFITKNYYSSPACMNEMGAAWVLRNKCTTILMPDMDFSDMKGAIGNNKIAIKLDSRDAGSRLNALYDELIAEFGLEKKSVWERRRDEFIKKIVGEHITNE